MSHWADLNTFVCHSSVLMSGRCLFDISSSPGNLARFSHETLIHESLCGFMKCIVFHLGKLKECNNVCSELEIYANSHHGSVEFKCFVVVNLKFGL